jgi:hypothetical protein
MLSVEATVGFVLPLVLALGAGAYMRYPDQLWIGTATMIFAGVGLVILAAYHWLYRLRHKRVGSKDAHLSAIVNPVPTFNRDVWLLNAIWRAYSGNWELPSADFSGVGAEESQRLWDLTEKTFRQLAFDGNLPIWAKPANSDIWVGVPPKFWGIAHIDGLRAQYPAEPGQLTFRVENPYRNKIPENEWREFMTSRAATDALFPRGT